MNFHVMTANSWLDVLARILEEGGPQDINLGIISKSLVFKNQELDFKNLHIESINKEESRSEAKALDVHRLGR